MSFYLFANESVEAGVRRIVNEQIAQAIAEIDDPKLERSEAVHQVRKRCKKVRAVLRIVRPQFEETYQLENVWFRDTAKDLAKLRDSKAVIETYDSLVGNFSDQIDRRAFASVRRALTLQRKEIIQETEDLDQQLDEIRARLDKASNGWQIGISRPTDSRESRRDLSRFIDGRARQWLRLTITRPQRIFTNGESRSSITIIM
jgi:CHAD domain